MGIYYDHQLKSLLEDVEVLLSCLSFEWTLTINIAGTQESHRTVVQVFYRVEVTMNSVSLRFAEKEEEVICHGDAFIKASIAWLQSGSNN